MPVYIKGKKKYEFETGTVINDINSPWPEQQFFTVDGVTVQLRTSIGENNKRSIQLVVVSEGDALSVQEIYDIMDYRVKTGQATAPEKAAMWQLNYEEMAKATALADGNGDSNAYNTSILTEKQVLGQAPLPNLKQKFPWAFASQEEIESDKKWQKWPIIGSNAAFRERCRANLAEIRKREDLSQDISTSDVLKMQAGVAAKQLSLNKPQSDNTNNPQPQRPAQRPQYHIKDNGGHDRA